MARSRDAGYVSAFEVGVANTEIKDESYKSHSVSRMRTRDRGYVSKTTIAGFIDESFEPIATTTVGSGGSSSITFSSIPATYKHLQLRFLARNSGDNISARATFNSDSSSVYTLHELFGDGASALAAAQTGIAYYPTGLVGPNSSSGVFGVSVTDILDYADTNKFKTARTLTGYDINGGAGYVELTSGVWRSTSAISSITIVPNAGNFVQYSHFALYGIKG